MVHQVEVNGEQVIVGGNGYLVASKSEVGGWHVCRRVNGVMTCDCKGYQYRYVCRHVRAVESYAKAHQVVEKAAPRREYHYDERGLLIEEPPAPRKPAPTFAEFTARYAKAS